MKKIAVTIMLSLICTIAADAQKFIALAKDTKIFETPIAKDEYAALNSAGKDVILFSGMCFMVKELKGGWYTIEYTPGLRGMIMQNVIADKASFKKPVAGEYSVVNSPAEKISVTNNGKWLLNTGTEQIVGTEDNNIVIFLDKEGNQCYSLTNINGKNFLYCYKNSITNFY